MKWDVVVIGGGVGGLACAGLLAARGRSVIVLEQGAWPGGYLASFARRGFVFDSAVDCIAGLDANGLLTWLLDTLGVGAHVTPVSVAPIRISRFPGLQVPVDASLPAYMERLSRLFPTERHGIVAFFRRAQEIYADFAALMEAVKDPAGAHPRPSNALIRYGHLTYAGLLRLDLREPRLAAVLSDRCPFLGLSPARASATRMIALIMSYFSSGAFRVRGGHQRLPDALVEGIRQRGGEVRLGRAAARIEIRGGRCARVLTEDGQAFPADHVVSSADFRETFGRLIGGEIGQAVLAEAVRRPRSPSFFIAYAGARRETPPEASSIGSFASFDLDALLTPYVPFSAGEPLGVTIPSVEDPGLAPAGHDVLLIHELVPAGYACDWERHKDARMARLLEATERVMPRLTARLVHCEAATPETLERYTRNCGGAAYGWDQVPHLWRVRHGIENLHLAGHWSEIGGGVLAAAYSGMRVAARILRMRA
jgi:phytoene dehydrogenase-like protein